MSISTHRWDSEILPGVISQTACVWCVLSCFSCIQLYDPMDCSPPGSSVHGFSRQEYWGELLFPSPGDLPDPGIKSVSDVSCIDWGVLYHECHLGPPDCFLIVITYVLLVLATLSSLWDLSSPNQGSKPRPQKGTHRILTTVQQGIPNYYSL